MFLFLLFSVLLLRSFFQIKRIISSEKWFNYVIWFGWTMLNGGKKEDGLSSFKKYAGCDPIDIRSDQGNE